MPELSPAAEAIWEAFNEDEAGVFVDYGEKLAAALRAAADHVDHDWSGFNCVDALCEIAAELEAQ
jgi:cytochrome c556